MTTIQLPPNAKNCKVIDDLVYVHCPEEGHIIREGEYSFENWTNSSCWELFERRCVKHPKEQCLGYKPKMSNGKVDNSLPFQWYTSEDAMNMATHIGSGLKKQYNLKKGDMVGLFIPNRAEWVITACALHRIGLVPIPLYATLGVGSINYIIDLTEMSVIFVSSETIPKADQLESTKHKLRYIYLDPIVPYSLEKYEMKTLDEIIQIGKENPCENDLPNVDDTYAIFFTSGTSGLPKGVVHTHRSFHSAVAAYAALNFLNPKDVAFGDTHFVYLPLAHVFQHESCYCYLYGNGRVAFNAGGLGALLSEIQDCNPNHIIAVPRVLQRVKMAFDAYMNSTNFISRMITPASSLLGKNMKCIINGSAPLTVETYNFFRQQLPNCQIVQGYGSTETFGGACCCIAGVYDPEILSIGPPMYKTEVRIRSVPDMDYYTTNNPPQGELEIRSANLFKEYYKRPELTAESFTEDGWFKSGDIVKLNPDGTVSIIDRKSNLIKLAQGEFVAIETVEYAMLDKFVAQAFVHGVSTDNFITAVVVPTADGKALSDEEMLKHIHETLAAKGLPSFSIPKAIHIEHVPFSEDNDLLTPSMKLRRANLKVHYAWAIQAMREKINSGI